PEGFERLSRLPGQRGRTESIGDLESGLLGKISPANRGSPCPGTRNRMGAASRHLLAGCERSDSLFPAAGARQSTRNFTAHAGLTARVPQANAVPGKPRFELRTGREPSATTRLYGV